MNWRLHQGVTLRRRLIAGECVVYQVESGDTHIFTEQALAILDILKKGTFSEAELTTELHSLSPTRKDVLAEQINGLMLNLERYGIVERYSS